VPGRNLRTTAARHRDFVKSSDRWQGVATLPAGSVQAQHLGHGGRAHLPGAYAQLDVELANAVTAHRPLGATDDTIREILYVRASRASQGTRLYVATEDLINVNTERPEPTPMPPDTILRQSKINHPDLAAWRTATPARSSA